jgi:hypothetical protein
MLSKIDQDKAEIFEKIIEEAGLDFTPETVIKCIEIAKVAMKNGDCSVEAFYKAKEILISRLECPSELLN